MTLDNLDWEVSKLRRDVEALELENQALYKNILADAERIDRELANQRWAIAQMQRMLVRGGLAQVTDFERGDWWISKCGGLGL